MLCVRTWPLANIRANIASRYTRPHNSPFLAASEQWSVIWTIRESNVRPARLEDGQFCPLGDVGWRWLEMRLWREIVDGGGRSPFKSGAGGGGRVSFFIRSLSALPPWTISVPLVPRACFATSHPRSHFFKATKTQSPRGFAPSECIGTKLKKA